MINPHELRIGNLVKPGPEHMPPFDVEKYCEVTQVYKDGFTVDYHYPGQWFEEIPLTPELLEKCGFEKVGNLYSFYIKAKTQTQKRDYEFIQAGNTCIVNNRLHTETGFLHRQQNLIFTLTGEELLIKL